MWPPKQCRQILESLNHVLYTELNFVGNGQDYYNQDNTYINQVRSISTTLCHLDNIREIVFQFYSSNYVHMSLFEYSDL